jgi:hypothetical protein
MKIELFTIKMRSSFQSLSTSGQFSSTIIFSFYFFLLILISLKNFKENKIIEIYLVKTVYIQIWF